MTALYRKRASLSLDSEARHVLELPWKSFVRSAAQLNEEGDHRRLAAINERLATLGTAFSQNILADEDDYALVLNRMGFTDRAQRTTAKIPVWSH